LLDEALVRSRTALIKGVTEDAFFIALTLLRNKWRPNKKGVTRMLVDTDFTLASASDILSSPCFKRET
jgi:hypothetical protein